MADLGATRTLGTRAVGDVGALVWVAEQLDLAGHIDRACAGVGAKGGPSVGEMVVAVAIQRACLPGPKRDLVAFLEGSLPRISCLPASAFTGQAFHRLGQKVTDAGAGAAQVAIAKAAVGRFELSTDVLAFDTTNFDTHIATTTAGELARRGHAKSKRSDLRVVGLALLVSETGHVPLLYRSYAGNSSDQGVLASCLDGLARLHDALDEGEWTRAGPRSGRWCATAGSGARSSSWIWISSGTTASSRCRSATALQRMRWSRRRSRGAMKRLKERYKDVRAARVRTKVGELDRTLIVVESRELLEGQKRGIAAALRKAKVELRTLEQLVQTGRIRRKSLEQRVGKALGREHLASFVVTEVGGTGKSPTFSWRVDLERRMLLEQTRLGRRVLCTDRHTWSTERIVHAFRGQWNVEELFRRSKKGGVVPWGPSFQRADSSLRLHTFATMIGLMLVSLAKIALATDASARRMLESLAEIKVILVRTTTGGAGRRPTVMLAPELTPEQRRAVKVFELERWFPQLFHV